MSTLNISLPESMRAYIDEKVAEGGYSTASEYVRELVRADQKQAAQDKLEALLLEGLESGESIEVDEQWWHRKKADLLARLERKGDS